MILTWLSGSVKPSEECTSSEFTLKSYIAICPIAVISSIAMIMTIKVLKLELQISLMIPKISDKN